MIYKEKNTGLLYEVEFIEGDAIVRGIGYGLDPPMEALKFDVFMDRFEEPYCDTTKIFIGSEDS